MPIYEYRCVRCGKAIEEVRSVKERDGRLFHKGCGGGLKRRPALPAPPQFRGRGFYVTDYRVSK